MTVIELLITQVVSINVFLCIFHVFTENTQKKVRKYRGQI